METKEISELTRSNRIAMLSHISTVTVMVFFMIWESVRGQLSPVYMTIATVVGVIPLIGEVICWKSNTEHAMIIHLVSYGFSLFYTICLFTSPTNLIYVFVIPIEAEIDFKKAAKVVGEKSLEMLHLKDLTKVTGYVRGGCTAIGMKKQFPTVIQEDAKELEYMHVSGGKLGMQIRLAPLDLQKVAKAEFADVIRP